jgi:hypothetical protein
MDIPPVWEKIQEISVTEVDPPDYLLLLGALDIGWKVEQPVLELIPFEVGKSSDYLFKLRHDLHKHPQYLKIQGNRAVDKIIFDEKWKVMAYLAEDYLNWPAHHF